MRITALLFCSAIVCVAGLLMLTCSKSDNPTGPGDTSLTWSYTVSGDYIIIEHPESIERDCDPDLVADTTPAYTDSAWIQISAGNDTMRVVPSDDPQDTMVFVRVGTGTGIQGQWVMDEQGFEMTLDVGPSTISASTCLSDMFMAFQGPIIEAMYDVSVTQASCSSVQLTGNVSGEIVTINFTQSGSTPDDIDADMTFSSSLPAHTPAGTVYANPTSCPNDPPDWLLEFLSDNANAPLPKRAAPVFPAMKFPKLGLFR
ncbi:MAG: hypothetical protein JW699_07060 [Chitinispirillaceae bacterium]|nr:hypothetical protein [Chitinispirillaceae bacterium]